MPRAEKAPKLPMDRLDEMLARLKLSRIRDQLDNWTSPEFLEGHSLPNTLR